MSLTTRLNAGFVVCQEGMEFAYKFRQDGGMSSNAERFGRIVRDRRQELDYNQLELQDAGGPSNTTLTRIENGLLETLERQTAKKLDKGLRWLAGSARKTFDGGEPTPIPEGVRSKDAEGLRDMIEQANINERTRRVMLAALEADESSTA